MAECVFQRGRNVHGMDGDGFLVGHIVTTDKIKFELNIATIRHQTFKMHLSN